MHRDKRDRRNRDTEMQRQTETDRHRDKVPDGQESQRHKGSKLRDRQTDIKAHSQNQTNRQRYRQRRRRADKRCTQTQRPTDADSRMDGWADGSMERARGDDLRLN